MNAMLMAVVGVLGLVVLVCYIMIVVKMFQTNKTGAGVAAILLLFCGIGHLFVLIFGWIKAGEMRIKPLMAAYTVSLVLLIGAYIPLAGSLGAQFAQQMQEEMKKQQELQKGADAQSKVMVPPPEAPAEPEKALPPPDAEPKAQPPTDAEPKP